MRTPARRLRKQRGAFVSQVVGGLPDSARARSMRYRSARLRRRLPFVPSNAAATSSILAKSAESTRAETIRYPGAFDIARKTSHAPAFTGGLGGPRSHVPHVALLACRSTAPTQARWGPGQHRHCCRSSQPQLRPARLITELRQQVNRSNESSTVVRCVIRVVACVEGHEPLTRRLGAPRPSARRTPGVCRPVAAPRSQVGPRACAAPRASPSTTPDGCRPRFGAPRGG